MPSMKQIRESKGWRMSDVEAMMRENGFPKAQRAGISLAENSEVSGVTYTAKYKRVFKALAGVKEPKRKKPCGVRLRCTEADRARLTRAMALLDFDTMQDFLEFVVFRFVKDLENEIAAPTGGTVEAANSNIATPV